MIDKIVNEHRGGYCYEQNRLFCAYLTSKGYNVYMVSATIYNGSGWAMEGSHMALIVTLNQKKYLVDVGYADIPKAAMPITHDEEIVYDVRSEERRVGKECRGRMGREDEKKKKKKSGIQ